jgi:hypothetical protein
MGTSSQTPEDQQAWDQLAAQAVGMHFLSQNTFARNLFYLREDRSYL